MGLDELAPFNPREKVIEYMVAPDSTNGKLTSMTCEAFARETASESPAPGGGSVSAYLGALAAALGTMVANLSAHKAGWDDRWKEFSDHAEAGQAVLSRLLQLVDKDTVAFNRIMAAFQLPKSTPEEAANRDAAIEEATLYAAKVPLETMEAAVATFPLLMAMAEQGNPASASDAGVGALAARSAVLGAELNVRINVAGLKNKAAAAELIKRAAELATQAVAAEQKVLEIVNSKIS